MSIVPSSRTSQIVGGGRDVSSAHRNVSAITASIEQLRVTNGQITQALWGARQPEVISSVGPDFYECSLVETVTLLDASAAGGTDIFVLIPDATPTLAATSSTVGLLKLFVMNTTPAPGSSAFVRPLSPGVSQQVELDGANQTALFIWTGSSWQIVSSTAGGGGGGGATTLAQATANSEAAAEPVGLFPLLPGAMVTLLSGAGAGTPSGDVNLMSNDTGSGTGSAWLHSGDAAVGNSGLVQINSGAGATNLSGTVSIFSGAAANQSGALLLNTGDTVSGAAGQILATAGSSTNSTGGSVTLITGGSAGVGFSTGNLILQTQGKQATVAGPSGRIEVSTGGVNALAGATSGAVLIQTGTNNASGDTGALTIQSGLASGTSGTSGAIEIITGGGGGPGTTTSGDVSIGTGIVNSSGTVSGNLACTTGLSLGTASGDISVATGDADNTVTSRSGQIELRTGNSGSSTAAGHIFLVTGRGLFAGVDDYCGEVVIGSSDVGDNHGRHLIFRQTSIGISGGAFGPNVTGSGDACGQVTASAASVTVTFLNSYVNPPVVIVQQMNVAPALQSVFLSGVTKNDFTVTTPNSNEVFMYWVVGTTYF